MATFINLMVQTAATAKVNEESPKLQHVKSVSNWGMQSTNNNLYCNYTQYAYFREHFLEYLHAASVQ